MDPLTLQARIYSERPHGGHRVLMKGGRVDANAPWSTPATSFESLLVQEGVLVSLGANAATQAHSSMQVRLRSCATWSSHLVRETRVKKSCAAA